MVSSALVARKVNISVAGNRIISNAEVETPLDLQALILRVAEREGVRRFDVVINGRRVTPEEIEKVFNTEERLNVDIVPADVAAGWVVEKTCEDPLETYNFRS